MHHLSFFVRVKFENAGGPNFTIDSAAEHHLAFFALVRACDRETPHVVGVFPAHRVEEPLAVGGRTVDFDDAAVDATRKDGIFVRGGNSDLYGMTFSWYDSQHHFWGLKRAIGTLICMV